jgi:hypothetical protein
MVSLLVEGINFGDSARVYVGGVECPVTARGTAGEGFLAVDTINCTLPLGVGQALQPGPGPQIVRITNGAYPTLFEESLLLAYRTAPSVIKAPKITNIAAHKMDLVWDPPTDVFLANTVTGYVIKYHKANCPEAAYTISLGNVTTTSVRDLLPDTEYVLAIATVNEGQYQCIYCCNG